LFFIFVFLISCLPSSREKGKVRADQKEVWLTWQGKKIHFIHSDCTKRDSLVLFIHGSPGELIDWESYFQSESLKRQACLVSVDRPGFGSSDDFVTDERVLWQARMIYESWEQYSKENQWDWKKILVVGHSYGGSVALAVSYFRKPNITFVLLATPANPELESPAWYNLWIDHLSLGFLLPNSIAVSNGEMMSLQEDLKKISPLWKNAKNPLIVVQGKKDMLVEWKNAEYLKEERTMGKTEVHYLPEENHFIPWTQTKFIESILLKNLNGSEKE
jgi:pimeloyl-ACP methyl ester carboxylesterase